MLKVMQLENYRMNLNSSLLTFSTILHLWDPSCVLSGRNRGASRAKLVIFVGTIRHKNRSSAAMVGNALQLSKEQCEMKERKPCAID